MKNEHLSMQLIRNTYDVAEGKTIVEQLLADKINFLKKQIFKLGERFGVESPLMQNRVQELRKCQNNLELFISQVDTKKQEMLINCTIEIKLVQTKNSDKVTQQKQNQEWT